MLLVQTSRSDVSALISPAYPVQTVQRLCENMPASRLIAYSGILQETIARMSRAGNKRIEAELCIVRLCRLTAEDHDTLSGRLDALEEKLSSGAFTAAAPQKAARPKKQAAAEAEARKIVADAEREGLALLQQARTAAAENGRKLLREAEERAAEKAAEISRTAEAESAALQKAAGEHLEEAAEFIVGRVVNH